MEPEYICYCFKHTKEDLEEDVLVHGKSTIIEQIISNSRANKCNCKENNPAGK